MANSLKSAQYLIESRLLDAARGDANAYFDLGIAFSTGSADVALVSEGLDGLSEREREILRVTALYGQVGEKRGRLPNAVSRDLAARWGTTNDNIRAIRVRALKKLKEFLSSRGVESGGAS